MTYHKRLVYLCRTACNKNGREYLVYSCQCGAGDTHISGFESMATAEDTKEMGELRDKFARMKKQGILPRIDDFGVHEYLTDKEFIENGHGHQLKMIPFYNGYLPSDFLRQYPQFKI